MACTKHFSLTSQKHLASILQLVVCRSIRSLTRIGFQNVFFQPALNDPAKGPYSPGSLRRSPRRICKELPSKSLPRASLTAVVSAEKIRPGTLPVRNRPHCLRSSLIAQAQPGQRTSINGALAFCVKKKYLAFLLLEKGFRSSAARLRLFQGFVRRPNIFLADCSRGMLDALCPGANFPAHMFTREIIRQQKSTYLSKCFI